MQLPIFQNEPGHRWIPLIHSSNRQLTVAVDTWTTSTPYTFDATGAALGNNERAKFDRLLVIPLPLLNTQTAPSLVELKATNEPLVAWADIVPLIPLPIAYCETAEVASTAIVRPYAPYVVVTGPCRYVQLRATGDGDFAGAYLCIYARLSVPV